MVMNKRGQGGMSSELVVGLIVLVIAAIGFLLFYSGVFGKASSTLGANDGDVIAAAFGCSTDVSVGSPDLQKKFCYDFKVIERKSLLGSILGTSKQFVNCDYLNGTIKTTVSSIDKYSAIVCPATTWEDQCKLRVSENQDSSDYSILINGKKCTAKELKLIAGKVPLEENRYNVTNNCALVARGTYVVSVDASEISYRTYDVCKAALPKATP